MMMHIPIGQLVQRLVAESQLSEEEIRARIAQKMDLLSGLISEEGAAHIVANELNVKVFLGSHHIKIAQIQEGMKGVSLAGRVKSVFPIREFSSGNRSGRVANVVIEDETGVLRVTLWNELADKLVEIREGDIVQIKSGYVRVNNLGLKELHLNDRSLLVRNPPGVHILPMTIPQKKIAELDGSEAKVELRAHVVNVFDPRFFEQCSQCRKRLSVHDDGQFSCETHGPVEPQYGYVVNLLLDDGSGTVRATCWKEQADLLFGKLDVVHDSPELFDTIKNEVLGSILVLQAAVRSNKLSGALELTVRELRKEAAQSSQFSLPSSPSSSADPSLGSSASPSPHSSFSPAQAPSDEESLVASEEELLE